jgi:MFS family permease
MSIHWAQPTMNATLPRAAVAQRKADLLRSLRLCTSEGIMAMPIVTMSLPVNVFLTALVAVAIPLPKITIGLISALPFVGNFLQLFAVPFLIRGRPAKTLTVMAASLHLVSWMALGLLLPWLPRDDPETAGRWLIAWFLLSSCFSAVAGVSWNTWIQEWVPGRLRGKFFGRRNGLLQLSTLTFILASGWVLARWNYAVGAFQVVVAVAAFLRVFSLRWQWRSPTRPLARTLAPVLPLLDQIRIVARSKSLLAFVAFGAVWAFAANCFGPFYHVFMFDQLGFSAFDVGVLLTLAQLGGALSLPAWGRLLDRYGNKPVMTFSLILWQTQYLGWCFITPANSGWLYFMWTWAGMTSAGFVLGQFMILLRIIPLEARSLAIGINLATVSLVAAIAPVTGGWILSRALAHGAGVFTVYHWCFLVQPTLALASCLLLRRVHEPLARPITMLLGAMRNIRTLSGVLGLDFLVNYVFYRPAKR